MKKIIFLLLLLLENLLFSEYVKEGTYNGTREKKIFLKSYKTDENSKEFIKKSFFYCKYFGKALEDKINN